MPLQWRNVILAFLFTLSAVFIGYLYDQKPGSGREKILSKDLNLLERYCFPALPGCVTHLRLYPYDASKTRCELFIDYALGKRNLQNFESARDNYTFLLRHIVKSKVCNFLCFIFCVVVVQPCDLLLYHRRLIPDS